MSNIISNTIMMQEFKKKFIAPPHSPGSNECFLNIYTLNFGSGNSSMLLSMSLREATKSVFFFSGRATKEF